MEINKYIPEYWQLFLPYLSCLIKATWPASNPFSNDAAGTHNVLREILKETLTDLTTSHPKTKGHYACVTASKAHPISGCWCQLVF